ncbi:inorganic phosphate transporter [Flavobacteriaceae bacterium 14752]|uniref:inorganic phosphate transporter n=1 Tax=Mesohalobacter salilacus TaxID=2491711 RepID=UPI000F62DDE6|nr:inorganic phosphate transporter [Flavobacteriaceae bacterium 14752]
METFYIIIIILLFVLAIADLIVGVSNDAVNFLNSAIGSKAIPMRTILAVAGAGVLVGAVFSSGLMEVARKGIFMPELFFFDEIIIIFLAVLITDILLLDVFNSFGIPTSTTVSVVFELLGASVCIAALKIYYDPTSQMTLSQYINVDKATDITLGILLSVLIAFVVGAVVQFISRLVFTFEYLKKPTWLKALFGGVSLSAITYFILIKGINSIQFIGENFIDLVKSNTLIIIVLSLLSWTIISWLVQVLRFNLFKFIIVLGTFALALAFAGNDLVNFIGVSIAAWQSFELWLVAFQTQGILPSEFSMTALSGEVETPEYMLIIAGFIMVLTLWFSSKAQYVVQTGVNLSRQGEGDERFNANLLSRKIVRLSYYVGLGVKTVLPHTVQSFANSRFSRGSEKAIKHGITKPAFDLLRASINLVLASILISIATNFTLPLSTTYITFMVAMGTSFGDKAWGRESAVYRVAGVLNVIGSWLLTAVIAFSLAALVALIIYFGDIYAIVALVAFVVFSLIRSGLKHTKRVKSQKQKKRFNRSDIITINDITAESSHNITSVIQGIDIRYTDLVNNIGYHDLAKLKKTLKELPELENEIDDLKDNIFYYIKSLEDDTVEASKFYILTLDYLQDMVQSMAYMIRTSHKYVNNNHRNLKFNQIRELKSISRDLSAIFAHLKIVFQKNEFDDIEFLIQQKKELQDLVSALIQKQIERIRTTDMGQQNTKLYFGLLLETKDMITAGINMLNLFYDYYTEAKEEF